MRICLHLFYEVILYIVPVLIIQANLLLRANIRQCLLIISNRFIADLGSKNCLFSHLSQGKFYIKRWQTWSRLSSLSRQWCNQQWTSGALNPFLWVQRGREAGEEAGGMKDVTWVFVWQFFLSVSSPLLAALINNINQSLMSAQLDPGSARQQPNNTEPQVHKYAHIHKITCIKQYAHSVVAK